MSWRESVSEVSTRDRADQDRHAELVEPLHLVHDGVVLLPAGLVDPVVLVEPADGPVGRDDGDLEPVDREELLLFGLGRAGHAGQLVVHPEVVLDRDGGEGLGLALHLHRFLGLHRLVQPVGPAPAGHDPAGELVHDHHLAVLHQVVHFLLVEGVGLEQLVDDVELLALHGVLGLDLAPLRTRSWGVSAGSWSIWCTSSEMSGTRKSVGIVGRHRRGAPVGEVHRVALLVQHEVERFLELPHALLPHGQLAVGDVIQLHPLHRALHARLVQHLEQLLVLGHAEPGDVELDAPASGSVLAIVEQRLGFGQQGVGHAGLLPDQLDDLAVELGVLVVALVPHRAGDDERRPRLVDQDRVHLVDDRVGVLPLDPLVQREHHVVAQVVEPELVVGAVGDVGHGRPRGARARRARCRRGTATVRPRQLKTWPIHCESRRAR